MKKESFILFALFLTIFISGCTNSLFSTKDSVGSGPNGIQIKFIQPADIFSSQGIPEGNPLPIEIELTNYGECVVVGNLCIKDTLSDSFGGVIEQCKDIELEEAKINNKKLEIDRQQFNFYPQPYSNLFKDQDTNLQATVKYGCNIITGPDGLCTKSPSNREDPQCNPFEVISGSKLGAKVAPITVSEITKQLYLGSSGRDVRLIANVELQKMSKGKVSVEQETQDSSNLKGNPVKVEVDYAGSLMTCTGRDYKDGFLYWKSNENEKIINCEILLSSTDFQQNPLNIHLSYVYEITESKLIRIKDIEKEEGVQ